MPLHTMAMAKKWDGRGRCHLCCEFGQLTDEHFPPRSSGNDKWTHYHTLVGMTIGSQFNKAPPLAKAPGGIKRRSLCLRCNAQTARWYNSAFADWTLQALELAQKIPRESYVSQVFHEIRPLSVLKQAVVMALAAADFGVSVPLTHLRRFALLPFEPYLPAGIEVRAYLNPPRRPELANDKMLLPNRVATGGITMDVVDGTALNLLAEVALPPMGYLILFNDGTMRLSPSAAELTDISWFGRYRWGQGADVRLRLAVRNPFGPSPGYYPKF